jgi:hypothetical protein
VEKKVMPAKADLKIESVGQESGIQGLPQAICRILVLLIQIFQLSISPTLPLHSHSHLMRKSSQHSTAVTLTTPSAISWMSDKETFVGVTNAGNHTA